MLFSRKPQRFQGYSVVKRFKPKNGSITDQTQVTGIKRISPDMPRHWLQKARN